MLKILTTLIITTAVHAVNFRLINNEPGPIWVGIQGNPGHAHLSNGGLKLKIGGRTTLEAAGNWSGTIWARTWCWEDSNRCDTGDCGRGLLCNGSGGSGPYSVAEITLNGNEGLDYYSISLMDGYNIRLSVEPINGQGDGSQYSCVRTKCDVILLDVCPKSLQVVNPSGHVVACNSACGAFKTNEYCCRRFHGLPNICKSQDWKIDYPGFIKKYCPQAFAYANDDNLSSLYSCKAKEYIITFG